MYIKKHLFRVFSCVFAVSFFAAGAPALAKASIDGIISINSIDEKSAVFSKTKCINVNGMMYKIEEPQIVSFDNSEQNRQTLAENIPEPFFSAVMAVWGDFSVFKRSAGQSEDSSETIDEFLNINFLNDKSVAFLKTQHVTVDGVDYQLGEPWAVAYENSARGRRLLAQDENIPQHFVSAVMAVWGDTPTIVFPEENEAGSGISE